MINMIFKQLILYVSGEIWKVFEDIQSQSVKQFRPMTMPLPRPVKPTSIYTGIDALAGKIYTV